MLTLGWSEETWSDPDLMEGTDWVFPLDRAWSSLTVAEQSAAATLRYHDDDFGGGEEGGAHAGIQL